MTAPSCISPIRSPPATASATTHLPAPSSPAPPRRWEHLSASASVSTGWPMAHCNSASRRAFAQADHSCQWLRYRCRNCSRAHRRCQACPSITVLEGVEVRRVLTTENTVAGLLCAGPGGAFTLPATRIVLATAALRGSMTPAPTRRVISDRASCWPPAPARNCATWNSCSFTQPRSPRRGVRWRW